MNELWDVVTHWQIVEETHVIVDGDEEVEMFESFSEWEFSKNMEIQDDELNMDVLNGKPLLVRCDDD